jgi:hypothetical protein
MALLSTAHNGSIIWNGNTNYLADIVRILHYTGLRFNFYDVIVAVLDQEVLREQIDKARQHLRTDTC